MTIVWFRQDLRIADNPALYAAAQQGPILPIYILEEAPEKHAKMGGASRVWLHNALNQLNLTLNGNLQLFSGDPLDILSHLCQQENITKIYWNRCYEPWRIQRDKLIKEQLNTAGKTVKSFNASLLWEPWEVLKKDGTPYRVFTPFYRNGCLSQSQPPRKPVPVPDSPNFIKCQNQNLQLEELQFLPKLSWHQSLVSGWKISEQGAHDQLASFLENSVFNYRTVRNIPAEAGTSQLSPYLHFGQISPHQIWHATQTVEPSDDLDTFRSELGWREFSYSLLFHFPQLPTHNLQNRFDHFPWTKNSQYLKAWQSGQTGYPIVDAGMRELWQTGYMHNRVRMIVGSFLVKNLLIDWRLGEAWFWDCLFDADLASNSASWQWIAGCGADAAPYFRIFNPITQGEKFDPEGVYTRRYVPELQKLPNKYLFKPWEAPESVLKEADIALGLDYPKPIVDLKLSRNRALEAYKKT